MPQQFQRAAIVEALADAVQHHGFGGRAVGPGQRGPALWLRGLNPGQHVGREQGASTVVVGSVAFGVEPAGSREVIADVVLELDFLVQAHLSFPLQTFL